MITCLPASVQAEELTHPDSGSPETIFDQTAVTDQVKELCRGQRLDDFRSMSVAGGPAPVQAWTYTDSGALSRSVFDQRAVMEQFKDLCMEERVDDFRAKLQAQVVAVLKTHAVEPSSKKRMCLAVNAAGLLNQLRKFTQSELVCSHVVNLATGSQWRSSDVSKATLAQAYCERAFAKLNTGQITGAVADSNAALSLMPRHYRALTVRAFANLMRTRYKEANQDALLAYNIAPQDSQVLETLAVLHYRNSDNDNAFKFVELSLMQDPMNATAHATRAVLLKATEKHRAAFAEMHWSALLAPNEASTLQDYAHLLDQNEQTDRGVEMMRRGMTFVLSHELSDFACDLSSLEWSANHLDEALKHAALGLSKANDSCSPLRIAETLNVQGFCLLRKGLISEALNSFNKGLALHRQSEYCASSPSNSVMDDYWVQFEICSQGASNALSALGKPKEASLVLERCINSTPAGRHRERAFASGIWFSLIILYNELGEFDKAKQVALNARSVFKARMNSRRYSVENCLDDLASAEWELGNNEEAKRYEECLRNRLVRKFSDEADLPLQLMPEFNDQPIPVYEGNWSSWYNRAEFIRQMQIAFARIPTEFKQLVADHGYFVVIGPRLNVYSRSIKTISGAGYAAAGHRAILLAEKSDAERITPNQIPVLVHEIGHAVDFALFNPSSRSRFKSAFFRERGRINPVVAEAASHYTEPHNGFVECFALFFTLRFDGPSNCFASTKGWQNAALSNSKTLGKQFFGTQIFRDYTSSWRDPLLTNQGQFPSTSDDFAGLPAYTSGPATPPPISGNGNIPVPSSLRSFSPIQQSTYIQGQRASAHSVVATQRQSGEPSGPKVLVTEDNIMQVCFPQLMAEFNSCLNDVQLDERLRHLKYHSYKKPRNPPPKKSR